MANRREADIKQSNSISARQKEVTQLRGALGKPLETTEVRQEPFRSILRKAGKTLNVCGKQFYNLVDVDLSDDELEPQTLKRLSGPPTSVTLKRAFGIEEPRKSGQSIMDFFGGRWMELDTSLTNDSYGDCFLPKTRRCVVAPILTVTLDEIRRPWFEWKANEDFGRSDTTYKDHDENDQSAESSQNSR